MHSLANDSRNVFYSHGSRAVTASVAALHYWRTAKAQRLAMLAVKAHVLHDHDEDDDDDGNNGVMKMTVAVWEGEGVSWHEKMRDADILEWHVWQNNTPCWRPVQTEQTDTSCVHVQWAYTAYFNAKTIFYQT